MSRFEDESNVEEAIPLYQKCLVIAPNHQEARASLQLLSKGRQRPNFSIDFLDEDVNVAAKTGKEDENTGRGREGKKLRRNKRSSSSDSQNSSSSSGRFSSTDSNSSRSRGRSKKSKKSKKIKREASLSPFSKKMAQLNPAPSTSSAGAIEIAPVPPPVGYPMPVEYPAVQSQFGAGLTGGNPPPPGGLAAYAGVLAAQRPGYEKEMEMFLQRVAKGKEGKEGKDKDKDRKDKKKKKKDRNKDKKKSKRQWKLILFYFCFTFSAIVFRTM